MQRIAIIGSGKVAYHLYESLKNSFEISVYARSQGLIDSEIEIHPIDQIGNSFLGVILAVSDSSIETVSHQLNSIEVPVLHCSGATPLSSLHQSKTGVFYPCISFTKTNHINWKSAPVLVEHYDAQTEAFIQEITLALGVPEPIFATSQQRLNLHIAAVFQHNFSVMLSQIATNILEQANLPTSLLNGTKHSLVNAIQQPQPFDFITGPAIRNDERTLALHEEELKNSAYQKIYQELTEIIQKEGRKKD